MGWIIFDIIIALNYLFATEDIKSIKIGGGSIYNEISLKVRYYIIKGNYFEHIDWIKQIKGLRAKLNLNARELFFSFKYLTQLFSLSIYSKLNDSLRHCSADCLNLMELYGSVRHSKQIPI